MVIDDIYLLNLLNIVELFISRSGTLYQPRRTTFDELISIIAVLPVTTEREGSLSRQVLA